MTRADLEWLTKVLEEVEARTELEGWEAYPQFVSGGLESGDAIPIYYETGSDEGPPTFASLEVAVEYQESPNAAAARAVAKVEKRIALLEELSERYRAGGAS